jgi:glycosyltransferase involved in cell wall biosynthesis
MAPLGVDTGFFDLPKDPSTTDEAICLFVGSHLRDFSTLRTVAEALARRRSAARIVAISPSRFANEIPRHPRITVYTDVTDDELRGWYHRAALLLMPLRDATATSSILEAIACGTPVVASDVGGVRDYLSGDCAFLIPAGDAVAMIDAALLLLGDTSLRARMSAAARQQALRFSWPVVANTIKGIYSSL